MLSGKSNKLAQAAITSSAKRFHKPVKPATRIADFKTSNFSPHCNQLTGHFAAWRKRKVGFSWYLPSINKVSESFKALLWTRNFLTTAAFRCGLAAHLQSRAVSRAVLYRDGFHRNSITMSLLDSDREKSDSPFLVCPQLTNEQVNAMKQIDLSLFNEINTIIASILLNSYIN